MTVTVVEWEREPLVPVTATVNMLAVVPEQVKTVVPEPVTLAGVRMHVRPDGDAT